MKRHQKLSSRSHSNLKKSVEIPNHLSLLDNMKEFEVQPYGQNYCFSQKQIHKSMKTQKKNENYIWKKVIKNLEKHPQEIMKIVPTPKDLYGQNRKGVKNISI